MNKRKIAILSIIGASVLVGASVSGIIFSLPMVDLPSQPVTMKVYDGSVSYFDIYLYDVPPGYDVVNGYYVGWCADRSVIMPRAQNLTVRLYNSYDLLLPLPLRDKDWDQVNYILNHHEGATKADIQEAFWVLLNEIPVESISSTARMLLNESGGHDGYVPSEGELIAVLAEPIETQGRPWPFQFAFLQICLPHHNYEGLTPGYWKNIKKHGDDWSTPYSPVTPIKDVFKNSSLYMPENDTMFDALQYQGGPDEAGAAEILLRAATAGVLNAAHPHIDYSISLADLIGEVNEALGSQNRDTMIYLAGILDDYNNHEADTDLSE